MTKRFESEKEAQAVANEYNATKPKYNCPLLGGNQCDPDCVCYQLARVFEVGQQTGSFQIMGGGCTNFMFTGEQY